MKLLGFAPDLDPTLDGVITDCEAVVPSFKGLKGAPSPIDTLLPALSAQCMGAAVLTKLDGTTRFFVAEGAKLKEGGTATYTDVSRTTGGSYTTTTGRWRFAQFGNVSLAISKENTLQATTSGVFLDVTGAPKADIIETVNQFVFAINTTDATFGDSPNRWMCSALGNYADWVPSLATQAATGILTSVSGKLTAGRRFGDAMVLYKRTGLYYGVYTGPPFIWSFQEVPSFTGTFCQESVINIGTPEQPKHFFVGIDNFYVFDGSRPTPVGFDVKEYFFDRMNVASANLICMLHDQKNARVGIYFPSGSSTALNDCIVWNYRTGKWGRDPRSIEFAVEYTSGGLSYNDLGTYYATYGVLPDISYDSGFLTSNAVSPAIFNTLHKIQLLNGAPASGYFVTGDVGNDNLELFCDRGIPKWLTKPTSAQLTNYYRQDNLGDALTIDGVVTMQTGRFDFMREAKWHRFKVNTVGAFELNQMAVHADDGGTE